MAAGDHADLRKFKKLGWFTKEYSKGQRTRKCKGGYEKLCTTGFRGGRSEAHHVLPQESFDGSLKQVPPEDQTYVKWVMHVADWDINLGANLLGLPTVHSYELFFQDRVTLKHVGFQKLRNLITWFNRDFKLATRQEYLEGVRRQSPEGYAIHNPGSWGHDLYSDQLSDWLFKNVWEKLQKMKELHEKDPNKNAAPAARVPPILTARARLWRRRLQGRAKANRESWGLRHDRTNKTWFKPFTMVRVDINPLTGKAP